MLPGSCVVNRCYTPTPGFWENRAVARTLRSAHTWINALVSPPSGKGTRVTAREDLEFRARLIEKGTEERKRGALCVLQPGKGKAHAGTTV